MQYTWTFLLLPENEPGPVEVVLLDWEGLDSTTVLKWLGGPMESVRGGLQLNLTSQITHGSKGFLEPSRMIHQPVTEKRHYNVNWQLD